jgi:integrase
VRLRRPKGQGTTYQRKDDGRWFARLKINGTFEYREATDGEDAERKLAQLRALRAEEQLLASDRQSLAQYLAFYLETSVADRLRGQTYRVYHLCLGYAVDAIGHVPLGDVRPSHIQRFHAWMKDRRPALSGTTQHTAHRVLSTALREAVKLRLIDDNPVARVRPPAKTVKAMQTLAKEDVRRFLASTVEDSMHAFYVLMLATGLRPGEALALSWDDFAPDLSVVRVERTLTRTKDAQYVTGPPKTPSSNRAVVLPGRAVTALKQHRLQQTMATTRRIVFPGPSGDYMRPPTARSRFATALRAAGLPTMRLHDLRHTTATLLLEDGEQMHVVRDILGHSSVATTLDTYGHVTAGMQKAAAERMESLMGGA